MKRKILTLVTLAVVSFARAQNVNIPDANFKASLLADTDINTNGDNEISLAEAQAYAGAVVCIGENISDLTGIEAFPNITQLWCNQNNLTSLDLSNTPL